MGFADHAAVIRVEVRCKDCSRLLDEPPDLEPEQRLPCPACGSLGRERTVFMVPGEAGAARGTAEAAWLDLGGALARAASALEALQRDATTPGQREHSEKAWAEIQKALKEYREANRTLLGDS